MISGSTNPPQVAFVVVVHNQDVAYADTATVTWWKDTSIVGSATKVVPGGGEAVFVLGDRPDGFEIDMTAWPAQTGGLVFQSPEYAGILIFHVAYPSGFTWR